VAVRIGWLSTPGRLRCLRIAAPVLGGVAALLLVVVGCTSVTDGTARVDAAEAPAVRASMTASVQASAAMSSAQESARQDSLTTAAVHTSCEALSASSVDAINALNDYVGAFNEDTADAQAKAGPAVDSLNHSADLVSGSMSDSLSQELTDAMKAWIDSARAVATAINGNYSADDFNVAINRLNDSKSDVSALCDAAY
jgi:hypothetical protein